VARFRKFAEMVAGRSRNSRQSTTVPHSKVTSLSAGRIALGYVAIAILWIAFSDAVVTYFGLPPIVMTIKGTVFVLVTASLLYLTIRASHQAQQRTEAYLTEAQKLSHTGSWALDLASNTYVYVSDEALRIFGFDVQEASPTHEAALKSIHPEDRSRVEHSFQDSLRKKVDTSDEYRIGLPDGTVKYIYTIRHPVLDEKGNVQRLVGASADITELKRTQEAQRRTATYLADAHRLTRTGSWATDNARKPLYWSEEVFRVFGCDPQDGLPTADELLQRVHPEDPFEVLRKGSRCGRTCIGGADGRAVPDKIAQSLGHLQWG
jgi:PAS domain S-box-containing protein